MDYLRIGNFTVTKDKLLIVVIIGGILFVSLLYVFIRYSEQIKLMLLFFGLAIFFIIIIYSLEQPRRIRTPEEQSAYDRRKAELEAEEDFREIKSKPQYDFGMRGLQDDFKKFRPPKNRKRY